MLTPRAPGAHLANPAPAWLLALFVVGVVPPLALAGVLLAGLASDTNNTLNLIVGLLLAGGAVAWLSVHVNALAGLLARRHWARQVALVAQLLWVLEAIGALIAFAAGGFGQPFRLVVGIGVLLVGGFVSRHLSGGWDPGPAPVYEDAIHPHGWVTWASAAGAVLVIPFFGFVAWIVWYLNQIGPSPASGSWVAMGLVIVAITLPWFIVHGLAAYGLDHRHDYGLVLAIIGGVLWFFTIVGIPLGLLQLRSVWKVAHPVLAMSSRLDRLAAH